MRMFKLLVADEKTICKEIAKYNVLYRFEYHPFNGTVYLHIDTLCKEELNNYLNSISY